MVKIEEEQARIERFEVFLKQDPENIPLLLQLGDFYYQAGRFTEALECYERAASVGGSIPANSRKATVYLSLRRFTEAEALFAKLISEGERSATLCHNLGLALYFQDRFANAAEHFAAAETAGLQDAVNWMYLTYCLHHKQDLPNAVIACEKWMTISNTPESKGYLALLELDQENRPRAAELARQALMEQPENIDANTVIGALALEDQDIEAANKCFTHILKERPKNGRAWLGLGLSELYQKKNGEALDAIAKAAELMPSHAGTLVTLGWAKLISDDAVGAEATFRKALELDRNFAESHGGLSVALLRLNKVEEAQQELKLANKLNPANFGSVYAQSVLYNMQGETDLANNLVTKALERAPADGTKPLIEHVRKYLTKHTKNL